MVLGYNVVKPGAALCYGICGLCAPRFRAVGSIGIRGGSGCCRFPFPADPPAHGLQAAACPPLRGKFYSDTEAMNGKL